MAYKITYKSSVARDLKHLAREKVRQILNKIEKELPSRADQHPTLKGEFQGLRKLRLGDWRVIYRISGDQVLILRIAHRKDIYR